MGKYRDTPCEGKRFIYVITKGKEEEMRIAKKEGTSQSKEGGGLL